MSRWFRFYGDALNDPKVQRLSGDMFKAWVNLLCLASQSEGELLSLADVAFALRVPEPKAATIVTALAACGLLDVVPGRYFAPHNWGERQFKSDVSNERVERYRGKRKAAGLPSLGDYGRFRAKLIVRDGGCCAYCGASANLVVDHMIPIAIGGTDDIDNLALACKACNSGKAGRTPEQANMRFLATTAASALARYRDKQRDVTVTVTPPDYRADTEAESGGGDTRARAMAVPVVPLVSREAIELAEEVAAIAGHPEPKAWPPGWCGAPMRVQGMLAEGWRPDVMLATARGVMAKKRDGPAGSIGYFERAFARAHAQQNAPLPQVVITERAPEVVHVERTNSIVDAGRRRLAELAEIAERNGWTDEGGGGEGSAGNSPRDAHVRLLSSR